MNIVIGLVAGLATTWIIQRIMAELRILRWRRQWWAPSLA
jgi:hypothetical protein